MIVRIKVWKIERVPEQIKNLSTSKELASNKFPTIGIDNQDVGFVCM